MYQQSSGYNFVKQYAQSLVVEIYVLFHPEVIFKELDWSHILLILVLKVTKGFYVYKQN